METTKLLLLCFATFTIHFANGQAKPDPITCTAGNFTKTPSASITCHFNQDIKKNKKNFNVVQYPHKTGAGPSNDAGNYVLVCNWGEGDSLQCKVEEGYTFDEQVSDTLTLGIPVVKSSVGGVYVCQMVPDGGVTLETCPLNVLDALPHAAGGYCPSPVPCPDSSSNQGILIVVLIVVLIVLIILAVFVSVYVKMHYRLEKKTADPEHDRCIFCGFTLTLARQPDAQAAPLAASTTAHASKATSRDVTANADETERLIEEAEEATETLEDSNPALRAFAINEEVDMPLTTSKKDSRGGASKKEQTGSSHNQPQGKDNRRQDDRGRSKNSPDGGDDGSKHDHPGRDTGSSVDIQAAGNQGEGKQRRLESGPTMSPPKNPSADKGAQNMKEYPQPLQEDQSDQWKVDQVCQWLEQEGLGSHATFFKKEKVDGKRLFEFTSRFGLWSFGVDGGDDGNDRARLLQKIQSLKKAVNDRKAKMAAELKASQQKPSQQTASQQKTGRQKPSK